MRTFSITTLGCKVNHYESEQIASVLRARGLVESATEEADLRVVNTCSVTVQAASKSRYEARKAVRLPVLGQTAQPAIPSPSGGGKVILTGCWATSDAETARQMPGIDAVVTHHDDVSTRLNELLEQWTDQPGERRGNTTFGQGRMSRPGTNSLPIVGEHQSHRQRAFLKIQDGCDAHCTYCIIPQLRPALWSKPVEECVEEARRLVDSGHVELILTGIFLGAYGQDTALRRRQSKGTDKPLGELIDALCSQVRGLRRLRLSSLEPGDLTDELVNVLRRHNQIVPHFHLPLQSGSERILRRMNRQYTRDDFLHMLDRVQANFDRPAITTDIIVGFPGETDEEFEQTVEVARRAGFIHIHAFPFSPRPGTAAARWGDDFVQSSIATRRIELLQQLSDHTSYTFRQPFVGETVELLVERDRGHEPGVRHGRCERYFDVHFESTDVLDGDLVRVKIDRVTPTRTHGTLTEVRR